MNTLVALFNDVARKFPEKSALQSDDMSITYGQLDLYSSQLATTLRKLGFSDGKHIAIVMRDSPAYVICLIAIWKAACVAVPFSHLTRKRELDQALAFCSIDCCMCTSDMKQPIETLPCVSVDKDGVEFSNNYESWGECTADADHPLNEQHNALLVHTSGTTSNPKTVQLTHENLYTNIISIIAYLELTSSDKMLCVLPFHYVYGNSVLLTHLAVGAELIFGSSMMYPQQVVNELEEYEITGFSGVASTYHLLSTRTNWSEKQFVSLRYLTQAGGPMPYTQIAKILSQTKRNVAFFVMYGQTEASARLTYLPPARLEEKQGSVGIPLDGIKIKIVDKENNTLPPDELGEVCAQGPNIMKGYWHNQSATVNTLINGWLHTGDLGYLDCDGYLFLKSRKSEIIKVGAHRVNPREIEELIGELPDVGDVAILGVQDELLGEKIRIVIEGIENPSLTRKIMRHCKLHLPPYKMPKELLWIDQIPRTASGKIRKHLLEVME